MNHGRKLILTLILCRKSEPKKEKEKSEEKNKEEEGEKKEKPTNHAVAMETVVRFVEVKL